MEEIAHSDKPLFQACLRNSGCRRFARGLHALNLGCRRYRHLGGAQKRFQTPVRVVGGAQWHFGCVIAGILVAVVAEETREEERHCQRDAPDAEENKADKLAQVQRGVVVLGTGVDVPLPRWLILAHYHLLGWNQIADQDAYDPE